MPVAGETILLSRQSANNSQSMEEKVIKIKPITTLKDNTSFPNETVIAQKRIEDVRTELKTLESQKNEILQKASEDIQKQKESWEVEKQKLEEEARQIGYEQGFLKGKQESTEKYHDLIEEANKITKAAQEDYFKTVEKSDESILTLAIHIANKILTKEIEDKPEKFMNLVNSAINEIKDQSIITIYLHPENYLSVINQKEELETAMNGESKLSIYMDPKLTANSCLIEHALGRVDASIDTQLEEIRKVLSDVTRENKE